MKIGGYMPEIRKVMLLIETSCVYGRELLLGIGKYSTIHGPWMFYKGPPHYADPSEKKRVVSRLMKWANGAIIREPKSDKLLTVGVPIIVSPQCDRANAEFARYCYRLCRGGENSCRASARSRVSAVRLLWF